MDNIEEKFEQQQGGQEKKSRRTGLIITAIFHAVVLLFFLVTMAWVPPDPPLPKYGIEVNFGIEGTNGSGNIQNKTNPNVSESLEKAKPNPKPEVVKVEDTKPDPIPDPVKEEITPVKTDPVDDIIPVTDEADKAVEAPKKEEEKPKEKPKEETKPKGADADDTGKADDGLTNNEGDAKNDEIGDKGKKDGDVNADALIGGGSGGGASLNLDGWKWGEEPEVKDTSSETGRVTIKFKIDDEGTVISTSIAPGRTISATLAEKYRQYVENDMYFLSKDNSGRVANFTHGSITFVITSK